MSMGGSGERGSEIPVSCMDNPVGVTGPKSVLWRLIAANGREFARAAYPSLGYFEARDAVLSMQDAIEAGHLTAHCDLGQDGFWGWRVDVSGTAATGSLSRKESECRLALDRFLNVAPHAVLAQGCSSRRVGPQARLSRDRSAMSLSLAGRIAFTR
jgi:hypothetical protein